MSGTHKCPVDNCDRRVRHDILMCFPHWNRVPREVQRAVWATWRGGDCDWGDPESEYSKARQADIDAVNAKVNAPAAADAEALPASKHGNATSWGTCKACRERILWVRTFANDRPMPVDPETDDSHFATCPAADQLRKGR